MSEQIKNFVSANAEKILEAAEAELMDMAIEYLNDYIGMVKAAEAQHVKNGFDVPQGQPMQSQKFHAVVRSIIRGEGITQGDENYSIAVRVAENQVIKAVAEYEASMR